MPANLSQPWPLIATALILVIALGGSSSFAKETPAMTATGEPNATPKTEVAAETSEPTAAKQGINWWEMVIAIIVAFIAFWALRSSNRQSKITNKFNKEQLNATHKHNRLSVTPNLQFGLSDGSVDDTIGISLENNGVGPAILKKITLTVNKKEFDGLSSDGWDKAGTCLGITISKAVNRRLYRPDFYLPAGRCDKLFWLADDGADPHRSKKGAFLEMAERLRIRIDYESVYGQEFYLDSSPPDPN